MEPIEKSVCTSKENPFEFGMYLKSFRDNGMKYDEITSITGVDRNEVRYYIRIAEFPKSVLKIIEENNVPNTPILKAARKIGLYDNEDKLIEYFAKFNVQKTDKKKSNTQIDEVKETNKVTQINTQYIAAKEISDLKILVESQKSEIELLKKKLEIHSIENADILETIKKSLYSKFSHSIHSILTLRFSSILSLIVMAVLFSSFLIMQGQDSYRLMGLPHHNILAIGMVLTLGALKFWSAIAKSLIPTALMIGIALFEGFVLYSGAQINSENDKSNVSSRKVFLSSEIERIERNISLSKKNIEDHTLTTERSVANQITMIDIQKDKNRYSAVGGVNDLEKKLEDYKNVRLQELNEIESALTKNQQLLSKYKSEILTLSDVKNNISDRAVKFLIGLILLLNMYVFHCLGKRFSKKEEVAYIKILLKLSRDCFAQMWQNRGKC